jgi:SAM-dependent methyltransferase
VGRLADRWAAHLAQWRIPDEILTQAPESPWIHPVALFRAEPGGEPDTASHRRAREVMPAGGTVLDVGCGGGRAAFAVCPPAASVIGVDHQESMLGEFGTGAATRGLAHREVLGDWPDVAEAAGRADVTVCHHVAYNVADLPAFAAALSASAHHRVVLELPIRHPLAGMAPLWRHFWGLARPDGPTAEDAVGVLREAGCGAHLEQWEEQVRRLTGVPFEDQVRFMRIRLCLSADRDPEVAEQLRRAGPPQPRRLATIWWTP